MKLQATTDQTARQTDSADERYPLLVTGRVEPNPTPTGHDRLAETARRNGSHDTGHGSVYLPRYRFGSGWRHRRAPLLAA